MRIKKETSVRSLFYLITLKQLPRTWQADLYWTVCRADTRNRIDAIPLFKDNFLFTNFAFKAALKHIVKFVPIVLIHFCRLFFRAYGNDNG